MFVLCTVNSFLPCYWNLCQIGRQLLSIVDNSKVWGKWFGLADCLAWRGVAFPPPWILHTPVFLLEPFPSRHHSESASPSLPNSNSLKKYLIKNYLLLYPGCLINVEDILISFQNGLNAKKTVSSWLCPVNYTEMAGWFHDAILPEEGDYQLSCFPSKRGRARASFYHHRVALQLIFLCLFIF